MNHSVRVPLPFVGTDISGGSGFSREFALVRG